MAAVGDIGLNVQYKLAHVKYTPARAYTNGHQPITGLPHAHALYMTQDVVRIVYMRPGVSRTHNLSVMRKVKLSKRGLV